MMSDIKVGDWIEVTTTDVFDRLKCIDRGERYEVIDVQEGVVLVKPNWLHEPAQLKFSQVMKVEKPKPYEQEKIKIGDWVKVVNQEYYKGIKVLGECFEVTEQHSDGRLGCMYNNWLFDPKVLEKIDDSLKIGDLVEVKWVYEHGVNTNLSVGDVLKIVSVQGIHISVIDDNGCQYILETKQVEKFKGIKQKENENYKIKDWIEVISTSDRDKKIGIKTGDKYEVVDINVGIGVKIKRTGFPAVTMNYSQIKKVEKPKIEKQATNKENNGRIASDHYHQGNNGNDVWQFMDDNLSEERVKGFHQGNALKYITRYNSKHDTKEKRIEDLKKAKVYIDKLIELEEG